MSLVTKGLTKSAHWLVTQFFGPTPIQLEFIDDTGATVQVARLRRKDYHWLEQLDWINTKNYTIKVTILDVNQKDPEQPVTKMSATISPKDFDIRARIKWFKKIKQKTKNILIKALRVVRNNKK
jgi:hypothetical protein